MYFLTYYGEIFEGKIIKENEDGSCYILPTNNFELFRKRENDPNKFDDLCEFIPDKRIIYDKREDLDFSNSTPPITRLSGNIEKVFVFGAGASRYCIFGSEKEAYEKTFLWKPPLGFEFFSSNYKEIIENFPEIKTFIPYYEACNMDIELALEKEWQDITSCYNPDFLLRHTQIQFYIREMIRKVSCETIQNFNNNLYCLFLDKLRRYLCTQSNEKVVFISFNYDTILDHYLGKIFGYSYEKLTDYIDLERKKIALIKPHGSWNWGWTVQPEMINKKNLYDYITHHKPNLGELFFDLIKKIFIYSWGREMQFNEKGIGRYKLDCNSIEVISEENLKHSFPAILMPYKNKDEIMMSYQMFDHALSAINQAKELYLIGWKGNEKLFNNHILSRLDDLTKIYIINPNLSEVLVNTSINSKNVFKTYSSFEEFVLKHDFLKN